MSAITVGGELIHYEVLGRGRPVVLVHGWLGAWRYWIPTMQQLHMKYRVYALDLFGFGDSGKNERDFSVQEQAAMLDEFMDQLAIPRAAFIGHGLGAMVVAEFAFKHQKQRVPRAMLVSLPLFEVDDMHNLRRHRLNDTRGANIDPDRTIPSGSLEATIPSAGMMRAALLERAAAASNRSASKVPNPIQSSSKDSKTDNVLEKHINSQINGIDRYRMLDLCFSPKQVEYGKLLSDVRKTDDRALHRTIGDFDAGKMLATIRQLEIPYAIVHGYNDRIIPSPSDSVLRFLKNIDPSIILDDKVDRYEPSEVKSQRKRLENTLGLAALPNVGHFPMLEYERFGRLVNDFLEKSDLDDLKTRDSWHRPIN
ncbi:MAG: alpha/beta hydrolase [Chloroflexota bacterium]